MYKIKRFSTKEERDIKKNSRKGMSLQNSHRGLGRSIIIGGLPGAIGANVKDSVDDDYSEGYEDKEIIERAGRKGGKRGAAIGAGFGVLGGAMTMANPMLPKSTKAAYALGNVASSTGLGYLGGRLGARKNAKSRLEKPRIIKKSDD